MCGLVHSIRLIVPLNVIGPAFGAKALAAHFPASGLSTIVLSNDPRVTGEVRDLLVAEVLAG